MSRRTATGTATPQATAQSGKELRKGLLVVWERTVANRASSFYEAGIIESVDEGGESRRVHLAVLAPPPPPDFSFQRVLTVPLVVAALLCLSFSSIYPHRRSCHR